MEHLDISCSGSLTGQNKFNHNRFPSMRNLTFDIDHPLRLPGHFGLECLEIVSKSKVHGITKERYPAMKSYVLNGVVCSPASKKGISDH